MSGRSWPPDTTVDEKRRRLLKYIEENETREAPAKIESERLHAIARRHRDKASKASESLFTIQERIADDKAELAALIAPEVES